MKPLRVHGVPVHPVLVHFPVAGWTAATALALAALVFETLETVALYSNLAALVVGVVAMIAGFLELVALPEREDIRDAAARHMMLAASAWMLYLLMLLLQAMALLFAAALTGVAAFIVLVLAGHAGARLVYHYGLPQRPGFE